MNPDLQRLIFLGESKTLEFKKSTGQRTEAAKARCAMLNGRGGQVVLGVNRFGEIEGLEVSVQTFKRFPPCSWR